MQYIKNSEPLKPGQAQPPAIPFISKLRMRDWRFEFDPLPLMKLMCDEYKIDFDPRLAQYFVSLTIRCGTEIYDMDCLDQNAPPLYEKYRDRQYV